MAGPLEGFLVLDLTQGDSGPFCGMQLGDGGADVIKVEPLEGDWSRPLGPPFVDGDSTFFIGLNRNKRSIAVNLNEPKGKDVLLKLVGKADVFIESFRPGVIDEMGFGYDALNRINPRLVYCSISPFGQTGPYAKKAAGDLVLQGMMGLHRFHGVSGKEPVKIAFNYAGVVADLYASQAILAALFWRTRSGLGQKVETSQLKAMLNTQNNYILGDSDPDPETARGGFSRVGHLLSKPNYGYKTKDLNISFGFSFGNRAQLWEGFCRSIGIPEEIIKDERFNTPEKRQANEGLLTPYYEEAFKNKSSAEILKVLDDLGALSAPHHNYDSLYSDPNMLAQEMLLEMDHATAGKMDTFGVIWKFTKTPASVRLAPPKLGQHTQDILSTLGYSAHAIKDLEAAKVVKTWQA